ncbi:MAG: SAVED domain-containing protein, partial [Pseudothermotoga sp.]|nr:SAVED domain-containing protein [Pseudothermotoga sp.]
GVVIKTSELFTNANSAKQHIDRLSKVVQQRFSVIFNTSVVDNSFMLPLYIALMLGEVKQGYIFTGGLDDSLNIEPCRKFHEKERACLKIGKKLLGYEQFSNAEEVLRFLTCQSYDVAFLICFSDKRDKDYLNYSYEKLAKKIDGAIKRELFEKISDTRLIYAAPSLKKGYFDQQIHALYKEITKIVSHGAIPHISFIGPASLAMGIGMVLGAHDPVVLYHYQNNEYYRVIDLRRDLRIIKKPKRLTSLKKIIFEETGEGKDCAFVIQFASHTPVMDAEEFIKSKKLNTKIIKIFHKEIGGIAISDWTEEVIELMSVVQHARSKNYFERLHFFLSIPVPIAFALGMALGHFAKISIYQFTNNDQTPYFEAVRSEQLRF